LVFGRRERRGRAEGRPALDGAGFEAAAAAASFVASPDGSSVESAVFEGAAAAVFGGREPTGEGGGEVRADRIAVTFSMIHRPDETSGDSRFSGLPRTPGPSVPHGLLNIFRSHADLVRPGGIRAEITEADRPGRTLEGETAVFDSGQTLHMSGRSGEAAVADSADARIESPSISVATGSGGLLATGGVAGVLGWRGPAADRVLSLEDVALRAERWSSGPGAQDLPDRGRPREPGTEHPQAYEIEFAGDKGRMSGGGGRSGCPGRGRSVDPRDRSAAGRWP
jgi:hypothetical protein